MRYALDSKKMKRIDEYTVNTIKIPAMVLMEHAAIKLVEHMKQRITKEDCILAVCGPGNNGGDGVAAGRILHLQGYQVAILFIGEEDRCSSLMKAQLEIAKNIGIPFENSNKLSEYNIIIDAIFGIGLTKPITGEFEEIIKRINKTTGIIYSVDLPSGISGDDGSVMNVAVKATETITFGHNKIGLLLYPGANYAGTITVADIGFPRAATEHVEVDTFYYDREDLNRLPKRQSYSHKGNYGKVLIIAGSKGMAGAACLSARAAYRSGAGLVKVLSFGCNRSIVQSLLPEAIFAAYDELDWNVEQERLIKDIEWATAIVIGPGIGCDQRSKELLDMVISKAKVPLIIDADAITLLALKLNEMEESENDHGLDSRIERLQSLLPAGTILTPHLMELSRLIGPSVHDITNNLIDTAHRCSYNNELVYAIKDARTIVAYNNQYYINVSGNHGMATGGSGDVLTGMIAALVAQGMKPYDGACLAVYIHGLAGDEAAREKGYYSMIAGDIVASIEKVLISPSVEEKE